MRSLASHCSLDSCTYPPPVVCGDPSNLALHLDQTRSASSLAHHHVSLLCSFLHQLTSSPTHQLTTTLSLLSLHQLTSSCLYNHTLCSRFTSSPAYPFPHSPLLCSRLSSQPFALVTPFLIALCSGHAFPHSPLLCSRLSSQPFALLVLLNSSRVEIVCDKIEMSPLDCPVHHHYNRTAQSGKAYRPGQGVVISVH